MQFIPAHMLSVKRRRFNGKQSIFSLLNQTRMVGVGGGGGGEYWPPPIEAFRKRWAAYDSRQRLYAIDWPSDYWLGHGLQVL